jgi:RHS repeat-associated protein
MTGFDQVDSYTNLTATGTGGTSNGTTSRYGYDNLGRLSTVLDTAAGLTATCTRAYTLNANSNRTALTQTASAGAPAGTCPGSINPADSYSYDTADRLLAGPAGNPRASLRYDRLGRTRVLPSIDTVDRGGDLGLDFYHDDLVASISQNGRVSTFGLDPASRRVLRTDSTTNPATSSRTVSHYTADDDNPDSVTEPGGSITRNVTGLGPLAAIATGSPTAPTVTLQLANLHGDIAATLPVGATSPAQLAVTDTTEYGLPRTAPAPGSTQPRYGWLGTQQRDTSTPGGLTLMGVRLYTPTLGRFLTVDPIEGGSSNTYDYANQDPLNTFDLDGRCGRFGNPWKKCGRGHHGEKGFVGGVFTKTGGNFGGCAGWGVGGCASVGFNMKDGFSYSRGGTGIRRGRALFGISAGPALTYQSHRTTSRGYCAVAGPLGACKDNRGHRQYQVGAFSRAYPLMSWGVVSNHSRTKRWWND